MTSTNTEYSMQGLCAEQIEQFHHDGYLVLDDVLHHDSVVQPVVEEYDELLRTVCGQWVKNDALEKVPDGSFSDLIRSVYQRGLDYFQPLDISLPPGNITSNTPFHAGPAIFNLMTDSHLLDVVQSLIGPEITSNPIQHVRIKPPVVELDSEEIRAHITATDWHQDRAVTLAEADSTRMVTVWLAITDATVENGCLQVIPGSHKGKMLPHCPQPQLSIPNQFFEKRDAMPLPVKSGGCVLFHPLTVHGSLINTTDDIRWSFDLRYNVTGDATGRPMFPEFVARSALMPESELHDALKWQQLWLDARENLSTDIPVEIHRWPGDAEYCA